MEKPKNRKKEIKSFEEHQWELFKHLKETELRLFKKEEYKKNLLETK